MYYADETVSPIKRNGEITHFVAVQKDITYQRFNRQRIEVLHRLLRHNLRNQLNTNLLILENLLDDITVREERKALEQNSKIGDILNVAENTLVKLEDIKHKKLIGKLVDITENLESFSEKSQMIKNILDYEKRSLKQEDISSILEDIKNEVKDTYPSAKITIKENINYPFYVYSSVKPALEELVENGIVHNGSEVPKIDIRSSKDGDKIKIEICDNGLGLPQQERKVLERKYETPLIHGSGLGLWLVYWVIEINGGQILIHDNQPKGTTVEITLPIYEIDTK